MSDETNNIEVIQPQKTIPEYKRSALKVGLFVMICFILRYLAVFVINSVYDAIHENVSHGAMYITELSISGLFLQILPAVIGAFMFGRLGKNGKGIASLYKIPKSNTRALGNFPAVYGIAQLVNIITIVVMFLISINNDMTRKLNTVVEESSVSIYEALFMCFMLVVIAPVFEEFIFRGLIMDELKQYGNGFAIITAGVLFGLYHGNFQQCFYTAAAGIALSYIANATGSIFPTTIIHAIMNSIGAVMILLMSTNGVQEFILNGSDKEIPDSDMIWVALYGIFMVSVIIFIIVGIISAIMKIKQIKRYKVKKVCPEISNGKKAGLLLLSVPSIIAVLLIIDTFTGVFSRIILPAMGITAG